MRVGDPYFLYMCEAEGLDKCVNTRQAKLNAVINDVRNDPRSTISEDDLYRYCNKHDIDNLSRDEFDYILREVRK